MSKFWSKFLSVFLIAALSFNTLPAFASNATSSPQIPNSISQKVNSGQVLIEFKARKIDLSKKSGIEKAREFALENQLYITDTVTEKNIIAVRSKKSKSVNEIIKDLAKDKNIQHIQENYIYTSTSTNDTFFENLYGLHNTGQKINGVTGVSDADMDVLEAWGITEGSEVVVAVLDTGVIHTHPDLKDQMWDGTNCLDHEGNALGGCVGGYDFEDEDKDPMPTADTHGSHVAGIIGATKNNNEGVAGIAPKVKIMALKTSLASVELIKAVSFAEHNGAKIINASFGGPFPDESLKEAISNFDGLFIAAAGNDSTDHDNEFNFYPCDHDLDNIICVASTDNSDNLSSFSDYGTTSVDVAAPGSNIYSTIMEKVEMVYTELFTTAVLPTIPSELTASDSNWGTIAYDFFGQSDFGAHTTVSGNYAANLDSTLTSKVFDLSGAGSDKVYFRTVFQCDTNDEALEDYLSVEVTTDGVTFDQIAKIDESTNISNGFGGGYESFVTTLDDKYKTDKFQFRYRFITDSDTNVGTGCLVDDIYLYYELSELKASYGFLGGTSMATPYVVGLSALIYGYNQNLTMSQLKDVVLNTGDSLTSLNGKIATGKRINAFNAVSAFNPEAQITSVTQANDGSGTMTVNFKLKNGITGLKNTLSDFQYSIDDGQNWSTPVSGDTSAALSTTWKDNNYNAALDFNGTTYSYTFNSQDGEFGQFTNKESTQVKVKFKVNDGAKTTDYITSGTFTVDNLTSPATVTDPAAAVTVNAANYTFVGTAETNSKVEAYKGETLVGSTQTTADSTAFSLQVPLDRNVANQFTIKVTDQFGNTSTQTPPSILEDSEGVVTAIVSVDSDTATPYYTKSTTPKITILGEENMLCRYGTTDQVYSQMANDMTITTNQATVTLADQGADGQKTLHISCKDKNGNEQSTTENIDLTFTLDTTAPSVSSVTTEASKLIAGQHLVTVNLDPTGSEIDNAVLPTVKVTGLKTTYDVTLSSFVGNVWQGTFTLLDEDEESTASVSVSNVSDILGNNLAVNATAGSLTIDTVSPTAQLKNTPPTTDTSQAPAIDIEVAGDDVVNYKFRFSTEGPFSFEFPISEKIALTGLENGSYTIYVVGQDSAGNWQADNDATTHSWTVSDTTAPTLSGLSDDTTVTQTKIWEWDSNDPAAQYKFAITQSQTPDLSSATLSNSKTATQATGDGTFYLHIQAIDNNGNSSAITTVSAILDNTAPTVSILSGPSSGTEETTAEFEFSGTDVTHYKYQLNTGSFSSESSIGDDLTLSSLSAGNHTLKVIGRDAVGNWQEEDQATTHSWTIESSTSGGGNSSGGGGGGGGGGSNSGSKDKDEPEETETEPEVELQTSNIAAPFIDIANHWAAAFVDELRLRGVVNGKSNGRFEPDSSITRAELLKIIVSIYNIDIEQPYIVNYADVAINDWYAPYINAASMNGIVSGYADGTFRPNQPISRAEGLKILLEAANAEVSLKHAFFPDITPADWFAPYVDFANAQGLVSGYSDGTFRPNNPITRAELSKIAIIALDIL